MRVVNCARCGGDHGSIEPKVLDHPMAPPEEIERVLAKPIEHFTERNSAKNAAGFRT